MEIDRQRAGQTPAEWQHGLARYLSDVAGVGSHPHLAAALASSASPDGADEPLFDRVITRVLTGLLAPHPRSP